MSERYSPKGRTGERATASLLTVVDDPSALGFAAKPLAQLDGMIRRHIDEGRYPGCQIALARHGALALFRTYGNACTDPEPVPAREDTLWLLYSSTKVLTMTALWSLVQDGSLAFNDRVADHLPGFAAHGKDRITVLQLATHQAGFPNAVITPAAWSDHKELRRQVCEIVPEWDAGSRTHYHVRSAHWVVAALIEAVAGEDYRAVVHKRIIDPLGLDRELYLGVPPSAQQRIADTHEPADIDPAVAVAKSDNAGLWREAGVPASGGYATARAMATFYQLLLEGGSLAEVRLFSPRLVAYALRNFTGDRVDGLFGMPMHRALGPHLRGTTESIRSLGSLASPNTFGQGGVGTSVCWGDPSSGVSFAYLTNFRSPEPWHSDRLERISNLVHCAIE